MWRSLFVLCVLLAGWQGAVAQELEPRRWASLPVGANFAGAVYGYSTGSLLFDPALPVEDAESDINVLGLGYTRVFNNFGKQARIDVLVPYAWGNFTGTVNGEFGDVDRRGFTDPALRYSINFIGGDALSGEAFRQYEARTHVGASVQVFFPLGEYRSDRLVNLGTNRFTIRPQLGVQHVLGRWEFEGTVSTWFFTDNDEFVGETLREQDPLYAIQGHVVYNFKPGLWVAAGVGFGTGAQTTVDGVKSFDEQKNSRVALKVGLPINKAQGINLLYVRGRTRKIGGDFQRFAIGWSVLWGGGI